MLWLRHPPKGQSSQTDVNKSFVAQDYHHARGLHTDSLICTIRKSFISRTKK